MDMIERWNESLAARASISRRRYTYEYRQPRLGGRQTTSASIINGSRPVCDSGIHLVAKGHFQAHHRFA